MSAVGQSALSVIVRSADGCTLWRQHRADVAKTSLTRKVLLVYVGGTSVKVLTTDEHGSFPSGSTLTPRRMVSGVKRLAQGWMYDVVSSAAGPSHSRTLASPDPHHTHPSIGVGLPRGCGRCLPGKRLSLFSVAQCNGRGRPANWRVLATTPLFTSTWWSGITAIRECDAEADPRGRRRAG
jgi:hypothetical protein